MRTYQADKNKQRNRWLTDQIFQMMCVIVASIVVVSLVVLISTIFSGAYNGITFAKSVPLLENDAGISDDDSITNVNRPLYRILDFTGPAKSNSAIYAKKTSESEAEGKQIGSSTLNNDGGGEVKCDALEEGIYDVWFVIFDADGNELQRSKSVQLTIDRQSPTGLQFDESTLGDRELNQAELDEFVIGGSGIEQTSRVELNLTDEFGNSVGPLAARIKKDGKWRIAKTSLRNLLIENGELKANGKIKLKAVQTDLAGNKQDAVALILDVNRENGKPADLVTEFDDDLVDLSVLDFDVSPPTNFKTFLTSYHHDNAPEVSGIRAAIIGSVLLCLVCAAFTIPIGIGTAIFMEDFKPKNAVLRFVHSVIQLNINNLAGVPSIVYGILGVTAFVYMFSLFPPAKANEPAKYEFGTNYYYQVNTLGGKIVQIPCTDKYQTTIQINEPIEATGSNGKFELQVVQSRVGLSDAQKAVSVKQGKKASIVTSEHYWFYFSLPFGKGFLAAGLTLGLVVLPIIIISSQEAIRAVPDSLREASAGMGATRWQTVRHVVLPSATPGIMTGTILSLSRAIGEAAPVLAVMGGIISNVGGPSNLMDNCTALPIVIYKWAKDASRGFHSLSASAIIVLLLLLLLMNSVAIVIRYRAERKNK